MTTRFMASLLALCLTLLVCVAPSFALDKLHLKDGRILEGTIEQETATFVRFIITVGSIKNSQLFTKDEIAKIERDEAKKQDPEAGAPGASIEQQRTTTKDESAAPTPSDGATRVCFISLEGDVGTHYNSDALRRSVEIAKADDPDIIVLVVDSGGGAGSEIEPFSDLIHLDMKKDFRVVGWIRSAISAASMTIWNCEEMYMMREGNIGGSVGYRQGDGGAKAIEGAELEEILIQMEEISRRGRRDPLIMRAMQIFIDLSVDIDANGQVTWREDDQGQYLVNSKERILTLNSIDAVKFGVAKGIADTKADLMKAMGITEWVEVGQKADQDQRAFREAATVALARLNEIGANLERYLSAAQSTSDATERGRLVGKARTALNELRALVRRAPSLEKYRGLDKDWFRDREEDLRKLAAGARR